jgi:hypothetical protein
MLELPRAKTFSDAVALKGIQLAAYGAAGAAVIKLTESISRATSDAIRFEYELAKIAQTVNKTNAEIGGHADSIRKIAVAYGLSAPKIAETIRVLAQAGYSFKEAKPLLILWLKLRFWLRLNLLLIQLMA